VEVAGARDQRAHALPFTAEHERERHGAVLQFLCTTL
jgi:hypothetical protein